jgi:multimeric flavodoxin WrbA
MVAADLVLIAAPIFCWGFPAQIKGLLDRMFCMMDFDGERPGVPRLHDKPMGLLLTGGGVEADNADKGRQIAPFVTRKVSQKGLIRFLRT